MDKWLGVVVKRFVWPHEPWLEGRVRGDGGPREPADDVDTETVEVDTVDPLDRLGTEPTPIRCASMGALM